jgi:hypothetical protein
MVLVLLTILAVLALGLVLAPVRVANLARELLALPEQAWLVEEERERDRDLTAQSEAVLRRLEAKDRVALALLEGRLSLQEAARRIRDSDRDQPDYLAEHARLFLPGASEEERYCRLTIRWARNVLEVRPDLDPEVLRCLEAELEALLRYGRLSLP